MSKRGIDGDLVGIDDVTVVDADLVEQQLGFVYIWSIRDDEWIAIEIEPPHEVLEEIERKLREYLQPVGVGIIDFFWIEDDLLDDELELDEIIENGQQLRAGWIPLDERPGTWVHQERREDE